MYGRNVFMGYLNMKDQTLDTFDSDLFVRSGDIGKKDADGFLFITGRIKGTHLRHAYRACVSLKACVSLQVHTCDLLTEPVCH